MALNSFVTPEGCEIGRAQAAQAEAARVPPRADMNPILLKPEADHRAQVVVEGRVWGTLTAAEYQARKGELWPLAEASLRRLMAEFDLVIIEGAGSPAEINLKAEDIANMRVALSAQAPVLLVGDIDRGGVFASLLGTMELLEPEERALVAGFVINKFRGDPGLLEPGLVAIEQRLERPVLGVVPWIEDLGLAEEDSQGLDRSAELRVLSTESQGERSALSTQSSALIDIVVIRLAHIANFDDFDPLARRRGVAVRYVDSAAELDHPDLVILPGTKTTREDLGRLRQRGLDHAIVEFARAGGAVLGICGGYQMLGERIDDPDGVEGYPGSEPGLGLLPAVTRFESTKATMQVQGQVLVTEGLFGRAQGANLDAYEIHMGRTVGDGGALFALGPQDRRALTPPSPIAMGEGEGRMDGLASADGWVAGTYLHGLFHNRELRDGMLDGLAERKGACLPPDAPESDPYDRLAAVLRSHLDIERIRVLAGL
jgi:adenosylcobyric acid synthase